MMMMTMRCAIKRPTSSSQWLFYRSITSTSKESQLLTQAEINKYLNPLIFNNNWIIVNDGKGLKKKIHIKKYKFGVELLSRIAGAAIKFDHHPVLTLASTSLSVLWTTHSAAGITSKDTRLAQMTDRIIDQALAKEE